MEIKTKEIEYKREGGSVYSCQYHVVFTPKYRRRILVDEVVDRMNELINKISKEYDFEVIERDILPDSVHLVISCNPKLGIYKCITKIKNGTNTIREEFPDIKSRIPCLWTKNTFIKTVGSAEMADISRFIDEQRGV